MQVLGENRGCPMHGKVDGTLRANRRPAERNELRILFHAVSCRGSVGVEPRSAGDAGSAPRGRPLPSRRARYPIPPPHETVRSGHGFPVRQVQFCLKTASIGA